MTDADWDRRFEEVTQFWVEQAQRMRAAPPPPIELVTITNDMRREVYELISVLRDETQSRSVRDRCVHILEQLRRS